MTFLILFLGLWKLVIALQKASNSPGWLLFKWHRSVVYFLQKYEWIQWWMWWISENLLISTAFTQHLKCNWSIMVNVLEGFMENRPEHLTVPFVTATWLENAKVTFLDYSTHYSISYLLLSFCLFPWWEIIHAYIHGEPTGRSWSITLLKNVNSWHPMRVRLYLHIWTTELCLTGRRSF